MTLIRDEALFELIYGGEGRGRFTQDSPIMPDVWFAFAESGEERIDLLLEPYRGVRPGELAFHLREHVEQKEAPLSGSRSRAIAYDESHVVARLSLREVILHALPLTKWWQNGRYLGELTDLKVADIVALLSGRGRRKQVTTDGVWFLRLAGTLLHASRGEGGERSVEQVAAKEIAAAIAPLLKSSRSVAAVRPLLWSLHRNRTAELAVCHSRQTIKADAAERTFAAAADDITWAILDTGIDARHPAFRQRDEGGSLKELPKNKPFAGCSRVKRSFDFTRIRKWMQDDAGELDEVGGVKELRDRLRSGKVIDWDMIEPLVRLEHDSDYEAPRHPHGTHVAGILGGDWRARDPGYDVDDNDDLIGICPAIQLYDIRVLDENGAGDEFSILAALQFVRFLNQRSHHPVIHGVNLSLSIPHDVRNFACGRTPICNEVERLQQSGVVVVAAAGNKGYVSREMDPKAGESYRSMSITDPGNAPSIITVGATHGRRPHAYGVSYFSSRGPTGDGRNKPDLVAPGEKILGPIPDGGYDRLDGTSMAAPHVSGAAAILMSRHAELIGDPARIKSILCETATDLGRERYFQGAGLVDVLRALQSI
ncbi:MAG: S8 family peptidase [Planctomycetota bacterium]